MPRKVKSVRVPEELASLDLSAVIGECEKFLRDLESATLLKQQGDKEAAEALLRAREADLGRKVGLKVWEARKQYGQQRLKAMQNGEERA
ncbi:hypothetical protein Dde_3593 [Oleidesulfovibrio alaskensis G20]|uniref:Uncharacterized protein n=1 Tax=Oleidesulfovibrio alaskensis (strain ATCC BAA-1058 / DSM 17464 / G20) TaxID=207559 RepID=Q30VB0_OLEA2|nr:hypothetical protein [Oleidesulfovibrio alaskensis]ABB40386.1 hypothetical protein Dde_3593 [Oleidesulfovibrio alaskensis G20]MBG0772651.1 hypothetical protein [Oleidesulfovibrio alaskensis]MBL3581918.1 hypothetical protein [Oleidesulfovibrio alaskensis]